MTEVYKVLKEIAEMLDDPRKPLLDNDEYITIPLLMSGGMQRRLRRIIKRVDHEIENAGFKNHLLRIDELYAFITEDEHGNEGIAASEMNVGGRDFFMPFVAADEDRVASLVGHAENMVRRGHVKIKLAKFINRVEMQEIK
jgi:hypothetical protein